MEKKNDSGISQLLKSLFLPMAVLNVVCYAITLFWGFELKTLIGFVAGFGYMWLCYVYLARTCERAVELDKKKAKNVMLVCYCVRYAGLFVLCAAAMLTGLVNFIGLLLPQFYPRIVLTVMEFFERKGR